MLHILPPYSQMGIDLRAGGRYIGHKNRTNAKSENVYIRLLVKVRFSVVKGVACVDTWVCW